MAKLTENTKNEKIKKGVLGFPEEVVHSLPAINITGRQKIVVYNHRGIMDINHESIVVNVNKNILKISGRNLRVTVMDKYEMVIEGIIDRLSWVD